MKKLFGLLTVLTIFAVDLLLNPNSAWGEISPATPPTPPVIECEDNQYLTTVFHDNFNDGDADGWIALQPSSTYSREPGNWRVENQRVINTPILTSGDNYKFLYDGYQLSDQSVQAKILWYGSGYGGITVWHHDLDNWVDVLIYPAAQSLKIIESINGVHSVYNHTLNASEMSWYALRVDTNSSSGSIDIFLDDSYVLTQNINTIHRSGLSGFNSGNAGGEFDDFNVTSTANDLNMIKNSGFECDNENWNFHQGDWRNKLEVVDVNNYGKVGYVKIGRLVDNIQLYQKDIELKPSTSYELSFDAKASRNRNLPVYLHKHSEPYTNYGIEGHKFDLTTSWSNYSLIFTTTGFTQEVDDARLRFWFKSFSQVGDEIWIDNVVIREI